MYARQHTPPSSYGSYCQDAQTSFEAPSGYLTPDASPECGLATAPTPARSPVRQHGPLLLPKIRSQDQTTEPSTSGPIRHRRTASAASGISNYNPYARPSSVGRRSTSPLSNASYGSPAPSMMSAYDAGFGSGLNSPINLSRRPSVATHSRSHSAHSVSGVRSHSRSSSATSIDESVINRYGYPTYRNLPNYVTQSSAAQAASYNLATAMPMNAFPLQTTTSFEDQIPAVAPPVQQPLAAELQYGAFDQPASTTTLLDYLTSSNPSPALVQRVTTGARNLTGSHYWWDIRNLRSWDDFNIETISSIPGLMPLLQIPIDSMSLPTPPKANMMPESESALHDIIRDYYGTKVSAALNIAQGNTHMSLRSRKGLPTNQTPVDFVSNYQTDYEKTIYGDQRGRVVGIVKSYDQWNTGMRSEAPNKQVYYLAGLAHLHRVMREHGCRYGFIMTEIEMLCVRCGGDPSDPGQTMDTATVSSDAGSGVPLFGYLELSAPIQISSCGLRVNSETGEQTPQMTAGLALWYLHMLAKENPLPGIQGSWRMEVGGPAALTRQHCQEKDAWIPKPNLSEKREAKRLRGWVFPDEPLNRKELGKSKRSRSTR
ncbi:hypothetical protein SLS55_001058 [Diplodia seriata]|uniref:Sialidase n=1 Tax=Diplodia seriata TaxID=420778 RepID=A0ABR3CX31_9PEZI